MHGLKSHQGVAGCCMEEVLSAGITAWGGRGGEGGFAGWAGSLGSSAGARGQESELGERLMLEQESENASG